MASKHYPMSNTSSTNPFNRLNNIDNHLSLKTVLIAEETEYEIENIYIFKSPYIESIQVKLGNNEVNTQR